MIGRELVAGAADRGARRGIGCLVALAITAACGTTRPEDTGAGPTASATATPEQGPTTTPERVAASTPSPTATADPRTDDATEPEDREELVAFPICASGFAREDEPLVDSGADGFETDWDAVSAVFDPATTGANEAASVRTDLPGAEGSVSWTVSTAEGHVLGVVGVIRSISGGWIDAYVAECSP